MNSIAGTVPTVGYSMYLNNYSKYSNEQTYLSPAIYDDSSAGPRVKAL